MLSLAELGIYTMFALMLVAAFAFLVIGRRLRG